MSDKKHTSITLICDRCGGYGEKNMEGPFDYGSLHLRSAGWSSPPRIEGVGGRSRTYDLCRHCASTINQTTETEKPVALTN